MKPFSLLIKPASADCNLQCEYCFYLDHCSLYPDTKKHRMSEIVLEKMIASYMATDQPQYSFGWQGGEPTLMGVDFFRKVIDLQKKYGKKHSIVSNALQTNATMINDELAAHLGMFNFLVGVSIDGPEDVHNQYRKTVEGKGTHHRVLQGIEFLRRHKVDFNVLTLVNSANVDKGKKIFEYFYEQNLLYQQYIPCVEFDSEGNQLPYTITGKQWGNFLCALFDAWIGKKDPLATSIRLFDSILLFMLEGTYSLCHMAGNCCQCFVVEYNGDVYPCDFFVQPPLLLGNIMKQTWGDFFTLDRYRSFGRQKNEWNEKCRDCEFLLYCSGDCLKHRLYAGENPQKLSWLCEGWKRFFQYSLPEFFKLARTILNRRKETGISSSTLRVLRLIKTGRNEPCFCGSGKKFKKCHGTSNPLLR